MFYGLSAEFAVPVLEAAKIIDVSHQRARGERGLLVGLGWDRIG